MMDMLICLYLILLNEQIEEYLADLDELNSFIRRKGLRMEFEEFRGYEN